MRLIEDGTRSLDVADPGELQLEVDAVGLICAWHITLPSTYEKAHVELRKIIPKGTSIDGLGLDAWTVAGVCSHANSSMRLSIGDASPMALAKAAMPASLLEGLGLELVPPDEVETRPELIDRLKQERDQR